MIPTEIPEVELRPLTVGRDEQAFLDAVNEDRPHLSRHGNRIADKYHSLDDVSRQWNNDTAEQARSYGIWHSAHLIGEISARPNMPGAEVEIGFWLRRSAKGHGYASAAVRALTTALTPEFERVFAEVHIGNAPSIAVMTRAGYKRTGEAERSWGRAAIFEAKRG